MTTTATNYWTATAAATVASCVVSAPRHTPGFKLTHEERDSKSDQHQYGLCCSCDAGLDDRADFVCDPRGKGGFALMCNACDEYYACSHKN